ncbi:MAG: CoA transferase [Actinomycetota bacterium]|nr:CoA transferase [Actinomycetota bacterium]
MHPTATQEGDGMDAPLDGITIIEITSWMAAPSAGAILADLGADVVKVEPLRGDALRGMARQPKLPDGAPRTDYPFEVDNRGKRSIAVALDQPAGAELVRRLIAGADVLLTNLLPHRQQRYGLTSDALAEVNPALVHATLTGYGLTGPDARRPGYDVTAFFGRGAITDFETDPGASAVRPPPAMGDHTTGLAMVGAILAALRLAERTGKGQTVDVSLFATAAWTMATELSAAVIDERQPRKRDRRNLITPLTNRFCCADDRWIVLNMPEAHWWARFCEVVERPEWVSDPRFETVKTRFDNMPELIDLIDEVFATRTLAEWGDLFDEHGLIWGPARTLAELATDPQAEAIGLYPTIDHPEAGTFRTVANPLRISSADVGPRGPAPALGEHTSDVLAAAGLDADDIAKLRADGTIGG